MNMLDLATLKTLAKVSNPKPIGVGVLELSGYSASGSVTSCSWSARVISGKCNILNTDTSENWSAGSAGGDQHEVSFDVTPETNCLIKETQYNNGSRYTSYYIAGDGGVDWVRFQSLSEGVKTLLRILPDMDSMYYDKLVRSSIDWHKVLQDCKPAKSYCNGGYSGHLRYSLTFYRDLVSIEWDSCDDVAGSIRGPKHTNGIVGQWDLRTGEDKTKEFKAFRFRQAKAEWIKKYMDQGLTKKQAHVWFNVRANWKHENNPVWCFSTANQATKAQWQELASADGRGHGNYLSRKYLGYNFFDDSSFPRTADTANILSQIAEDSLQGDGWKLLN